MDYIRTEANGQLVFTQSEEYLHIPSSLYGFHNTETTVETAESGRIVYCFKGTVTLDDEERICEHCGKKMHINAHRNINLRHIPFGGNLTIVSFPHNQLRCSNCGATKSQYISFKADGHFITEQLHQHVCDLLSKGTYTNKQVAEITGLGQNVVKDIDKKRLQDLYTTNNGKKLKQPEKQARCLGIDEFKLHNGYKYATHITDLSTGHVLWIQNGKKKQVVYDFIDHVGLTWMKGVEAVACDMNSDFQEAFQDKCPWLRIVFDRFHIVKNFNEKVVTEVRKDEQKRLIDEGNETAAKSLKNCKYILMSNISTLKKKDEDAQKGRIIQKGSPLFKTENITRKGGNVEKYKSLIKENTLLFTIDLIKEELYNAYTMTDELEMTKSINNIIDICKATENDHFLWFGRMLKSHFDGIIAHATYKISTGKIEGINQKIKTLRRHGYGYPDDEYFFLKIIDASRQTYVRNTKSHKICH